jgi:peroxiredoxin Q/BCP
VAAKKSKTTQKQGSTGGMKKATTRVGKSPGTSPKGANEGTTEKAGKRVATKAVGKTTAASLTTAPPKAASTKAASPKAASPNAPGPVKKGGVKMASRSASGATASSKKPAPQDLAQLLEVKPKAIRAKSKNMDVNPRKQVIAAPPTRAGLVVGDTVPAFDALDQAGLKVSNREWAGAPYVLYFYPKDDTPGCTTEACGFRDELPAFEALGVKVVGCSPDSPNAHTRFAQKYSLQFTLLSDIEKALAELFGVWKLKQNYGREYMGVERSTFLIDKSGKVARQWRGVRVAGHVSEVLNAVRELS